MIDSLIALLQIEALYFPPGFIDSNSSSKKPNLEPASVSDDYWRYEYIPKDKDKESVSWRVTEYIDEYYPWTFHDAVDPYWDEEGEFVYKEVLKRVANHPDLEIKEGRIIERSTGKYRPVETLDHPLFIRFPIVARASFSYSSYNNEVDCFYWFEGVPDLTHLEDLIPPKEEE